MKKLISLTILLLAAASHADPTLLEIARNKQHAHYTNSQKLDAAQAHLSHLYSQKLDPDGADDRYDLLVWLAESPQADARGLTPLLLRILQTEGEEGIRARTLRALGDIGDRKQAEAAVLENLFPVRGAKFLSTTSIREEAARSLGKLQRRFPGGLAATLLHLEKVAAEKSPLTGAVDGIALCGMEHPEVRASLSKILTGPEYTELAKIRVVQWYRDSKSALPGMAEELRSVALNGKLVRVKLSAIHALLVSKQADGTLLNELARLAREKTLDATTSQYAKNLHEHLNPPELSAGPRISDVCHFVNSRTH